MNKPTEPTTPILFHIQDLRIALPTQDVLIRSGHTEAWLRYDGFWEVYDFVSQDTNTGLLTLGRFLRTENGDPK